MYCITTSYSLPPVLSLYYVLYNHQLFFTSCSLSVLCTVLSLFTSCSLSVLCTVLSLFTSCSLSVLCTVLSLFTSCSLSVLCTVLSLFTSCSLSVLCTVLSLFTSCSLSVLCTVLSLFTSCSLSVYLLFSLCIMYMYNHQLLESSLHWYVCSFFYLRRDVLLAVHDEVLFISTTNKGAIYFNASNAFILNNALIIYTYRPSRVQ